ncbi:DivIVA domain-containing protein [Lysobacter korlensis]|uniref:DivIVA domain-containing protein n=1 Tax=Lysobacter korlensis TaxID=553636 RepID=A0ABV6RX82_9GAMM
MALTPEDVVNKRFQPTKFREGYDQDEVDDFLDEVVVELRRINAENEELRQRLAASEARVAELQRNASSQQSAPAPAPAPAVAAAAPAPAAYAPPASDRDFDTNSTNNLLQLARRLHEEHVREGVEKRDALIAEGHATAARIVAEAEAKQRAQLTTLEQERSTLEREIDKLRTFEREYRQKLRGYIESQLRELETSKGQNLGSNGAQAGDKAAPAPTHAASPTPAPAGAGVFGGSTPPANYAGFGGGS